MAADFICKDRKCRKRVESDISTLKIIPYKDYKKQLDNLLSYFQYLSPNIDSSHATELPEDVHEEILKNLLTEWSVSHYKFIAHSIPIVEELSKMFLSEDILCCKCLRLVCKRIKSPQESNLVCLLRHLRNSIAHGSVYTIHTGNKYYLVFDDFTRDKKPSARIIITRVELLRWRKTLIDFQKQLLPKEDMPCLPH
jgi:hypothetical protein